MWWEEKGQRVGEAQAVGQFVRLRKPVVPGRCAKPERESPYTTPPPQGDGESRLNLLIYKCAIDHSETIP